MSKNTPFSYNVASDYHYALGKTTYGCDIDMLEYKIIGSGINRKIIFVGAIDWKYPSENITDEYISSNVYNTIAETYNIPFFYVLTYLKDEFPTKMYYIIPMNFQAQSKFASSNLKLTGEWCTLYRFSRFLHWLRDPSMKSFNPNEPIKEKDANLVGLTAKTLGELPNTPKIYKLPEMKISFLSKLNRPASATEIPRLTLAVR